MSSSKLVRAMDFYHFILTHCKIFKDKYHSYVLFDTTSSITTGILVHLQNIIFQRWVLDYGGGVPKIAQIMNPDNPCFANWGGGGPSKKKIRN